MPPRIQLFMKLLRFGVVGAAVFVLDLVLLWVFNRVMPPLAAVSTAYLLAVAVHFCLNKWWVFRARDLPIRTQLGRYVLTVAVCWLATVGIVGFVLVASPANVFTAKLIAVPPTMLLGFFLMRRFVFRPAPAAPCGANS